MSTALLLAAWVRRLRRRLHAATSHARSQATRHGQTLEQFAPFLETWPYDPKGFRFIGSPVDGIQFGSEAIVFVEIKSNTSHLSPVQREARAHVEAGRVTWREVRLG